MIEAILWDCDGVLQHPSPDWEDATAQFGGTDFMYDLYMAEVPALRGQQPLRVVIGELLAQRYPTFDLDDVLGLWAMFEPDEAAWQVVDDVRATGLKCVLATNQHDLRRELMGRKLGYDRRVDGAYYSCEVRAMKPDGDYFTAVLDDLGLEPEQTLFVDDNPRNVDTAIALGLNTIHHDPRSGAAELRRELAPHLHP
ncbi:HAD-IA family hydrolase [Calidifontibacter terrae]